jgi:hypothetical protein
MSFASKNAVGCALARRRQSSRPENEAAGGSFEVIEVMEAIKTIETIEAIARTRLLARLRPTRCPIPPPYAVGSLGENLGAEAAPVCGSFP